MRNLVFDGCIYDTEERYHFEILKWWYWELKTEQLQEFLRTKTATKNEYAQFRSESAQNIPDQQFNPKFTYSLFRSALEALVEDRIGEHLDNELSLIHI